MVQRRCAALVMIVLGVGTTTSVLAQSAPVSKDPESTLVGRENAACQATETIALDRWLTCQHIKVRESFEDDQSEQRPAVFAFESGNSEKNYYKVDVGVRFRANQLFESLLWYPALEVHRSSETQEPINNKSAALKLEYYPFPGDASGPGLALPTRAVKPFFLLDGKATLDSQGHTTTGSTSLLLSFRTSGQFPFPPPGQGVRCGAARLVCFRYHPYLGVEHFNHLRVGPEEDGNRFSGQFAVGKLSIELYPIPLPAFRPLEILARGEYRNRLTSDNSVAREAYSWSAQVNWYLDKGQSIALGLDYEDGRSPDNNFVLAHRYGLSIKLKLNQVD